ncbi:MAG: histidine phosphatase family protein [Actinomycetota bacterium]
MNVPHAQPRILFLVRHGRSDASSQEFRGYARGPQWDPPLDEVGRGQADLLARRLLVMDPPAAIYCSPMRRTRETIAPYVAATGAEVRTDEELIESHVGSWEGRAFEEVIAGDDQLLHRFRNQDAIWVNAPGAEDLDAFRDRVTAAIERILAEAPPGNVLVVCHGGVINAYLSPLLGLPQAMFFLPDNTSINSVVVEGHARVIRFLNDVRHLTDPDLFVG